MNATDVLPRLPDRETLMLFVERQPADATFYLSKPGDSETDGDERGAQSPCPLAAYMKTTYGFKTVHTPAWSLVRASGYGLTISFDVNESPRAIGYMKSLQEVEYVLDGEDNRCYDDITRDELLFLLKNWENPYDAAHELIRARKPSAPRTEGGCWGGSPAPSADD